MWLETRLKKDRKTSTRRSNRKIETRLKKNRKIATQTASINGCLHDAKMRFKLIEFTARHGGTKMKLIPFLPHYPVSGLDPLLLQCGPRLGVVALGWGDGTGHGVMPAGVGWPWAHGVALGCWRPSCACLGLGLGLFWGGLPQKPGPGACRPGLGLSPSQAQKATYLVGCWALAGPAGNLLGCLLGLPVPSRQPTCFKFQISCFKFRKWKNVR